MANSVLPFTRDGWKESGVPMRPRAQELYGNLVDFIVNDVIPAQPIFEAQMGPPGQRFSVVPPIYHTLVAKAKTLGLWNAFLTEEFGELGSGLSHTEFGILCELMGMSGGELCSSVTNCGEPNAGNIETLIRYGTPAQKEKWLGPLMRGEIFAGFSMTDGETASSDATLVSTSVIRDGDHYVINGRKVWASATQHAMCGLLLVVGKTSTGGNIHGQQSVILVPRDTPGISILSNCDVMGYDDAPVGHAESLFTNVRVPIENVLLGEGRGFEVMQGRLGPGRIQLCMKLVGVAERTIQQMVLEATNEKKKPFGKLKGDHGSVLFDIAKSRVELEAARCVVIKAAAKMDAVGVRNATKEIAVAKIFVPKVACKIIDRAIQIHGGIGLSNRLPFAYEYAHARALRLADGPDEAHLQQLGRNELRKAAALKKQEEMLVKNTRQMAGRSLL